MFCVGIMFCVCTVCFVIGGTMFCVDAVFCVVSAVFCVDAVFCVVSAVFCSVVGAVFYDTAVFCFVGAVFCVVGAVFYDGAVFCIGAVFCVVVGTVLCVVVGTVFCVAPHYVTAHLACVCRQRRTGYHVHRLRHGGDGGRVWSIWRSLFVHPGILPHQLQVSVGLVVAACCINIYVFVVAV